MHPPNDSRPTEDNTSSNPAGVESSTDIQPVPRMLLTAIAPDPSQPRQYKSSFGNLDELAASIKRVGVIQPVTVIADPTPMPDDPTDVRPYRLVSGERRWRASDIAGLVDIPYILWPAEKLAAAPAAALIENIQRKDLNPLEAAEAMDRLRISEKWTHQELANGIGLTRERVTRALGLLKLDEGAKDALRSGQLSLAHVEPLIGLSEVASRLIAYAAILERWTRDLVRQASATWSGLGDAASSALAEIVMRDTPLNKDAKRCSDILRRIATVPLTGKTIGRLNQIGGNPTAFEKALMAGLEDAERLASGNTKTEPASKSSQKKRLVTDPNVTALQDELGSMLGTPVQITPAVPKHGRRKGEPGRLLVEFFDNDQLEGILEGLRRGWGREQ